MLKDSKQNQSCLLFVLPPEAGSASKCSHMSRVSIFARKFSFLLFFFNTIFCLLYLFVCQEGVERRGVG